MALVQLSCVHLSILFADVNLAIPKQPPRKLRLRKSSMVAVRLREAFAGKHYGIAKIVSRGGCYLALRDIPLEGDGIAPQGSEIVDVLWYNRIGLTGLKFQESDTPQTIRSSRIIHMKLQWAKANGASRRGGREAMREKSKSSDDDVMTMLNDMREDEGPREEEKDLHAQDEESDSIAESNESGDDLDDVEEDCGHDT